MLIYHDTILYLYFNITSWQCSVRSQAREAGKLILTENCLRSSSAQLKTLNSNQTLEKATAVLFSFLDVCRFTLIKNNQMKRKVTEFSYLSEVSHAWVKKNRFKKLTVKHPALSILVYHWLGVTRVHHHRLARVVSHDHSPRVLMPWSVVCHDHSLWVLMRCRVGSDPHRLLGLLDEWRFRLVSVCWGWR